MNMRSKIALMVCLFASVGAGVVQAQEKIVAGYTSLTANAPLFVAKQKGFFEKRGLNVELQALRGGNVLVPSLVANSVQIATLTAPSLVQAVDGGLDLVSVTGMSLINLGQKDSALVVRTGSNVNSVGDLKGRRIAVGTLGSISQVLFDKWLMMKGFDPKAFVYVEASYPQMPDIIKNGSVDAVLIPDPFMTAITKSGSGTVLSYYFGEIRDDIPGMINVATKDWAQKKSKEVALFREAIDEAIAFTAANPDAMLAIVTETLKLPADVVKGTELTRFKSTVDTADMQWWIDTMNEQKLLRTKLSPAQFTTK